MSNSIFFLNFFIFYFWLHWVLVVAHGVFIKACVEASFVAARGLFIAAHRLLSSCGVQVFSSLVVAHKFQGTWAPERVGSVVCGAWAL